MADSDQNVLLLASGFELRGSSVYTLRLGEHLGKFGFSSKIICRSAASVSQGRRSELTITEAGRFDVPLWGRVLLRLLDRELKQHPPQLIHVQSRKVAVQGTWLARRLKCPLVITVHDYLQPRERLTIDPRSVRRVIAVSESVKRELLERTSLTDDSITVVHSGVETHPDEELRAVLDPSRVPVVGTAGPLEAVKGLPFFLGAAQKVLATHQDVEFLVSGSGPEEANLRRVARELGISEHVTFVSNLSEFSTSLQAMDIFCLPSLRQGLGTIMLEAMALAKPVIATGVGGVYSVVRDGETGLVIPPSDSAQLADRILELLKDPVRSRSIGRQARQFVREEFGVERMVEQTAAIYGEVLKGWSVDAC